MGMDSYVHVLSNVDSRPLQIAYWRRNYELSHIVRWIVGPIINTDVPLSVLHVDNIIHGIGIRLDDLKSQLDKLLQLDEFEYSLERGDNIDAQEHLREDLAFFKRVAGCMANGYKFTYRVDP